MTAPRFPITATGDGTTKDFQLGFPLLDASHARVFLNGVLKTIVTDYVILDVMLDGPVAAQQPTVRFLTAPGNGLALKFYRNTPISNGYRPTLVISNLLEKLARYRQEEDIDGLQRIDLWQTETDTLAGTAMSFVAPSDGYINSLETEITKAVTTGGDVTVEIDAVAVTGLVVTVANAAPVGLIQTDTPTTAQSATTKVRRGQTVTVTPAAAFATAGSLKARVFIQRADF